MKTKEQIQDRLVAEIEAYAMADDQAQRDCIERAISTLQWALQGLSMTDNLVKLKEWVDKLDHAAEESCFEGYSSGVPVRHLIDQIVDEMRVANESRIILEGHRRDHARSGRKSYLQYDLSVIPNRCTILSPDEVKKVTEDEVDIQGGRALGQELRPS